MEILGAAGPFVYIFVFFLLIDLFLRKYFVSLQPESNKPKNYKIMEEKKDKRVLSIELNEEELDQATGGSYEFESVDPPLYSDDEEDIIIIQEPYRGKSVPE